jgi:hypothetical protein
MEFKATSALRFLLLVSIYWSHYCLERGYFERKTASQDQKR